MIAIVKQRLLSLGYQPVDEDDWLIDYMIKVKRQEILNYCNVDEIPEELEHILIERICGSILAQKTIQNPQNTEGVIKSIKEGDVSIDYAVSNASPLSLFSQMANTGEEELICYRQMKW
ncbi:MAG: hypothetical protein Q4A29_03800 [Eubacteriales bacterium]|nr:hypothetical protein [Eubacteriales bacterium]